MDCLLRGDPEVDLTAVSHIHEAVKIDRGAGGVSPKPTMTPPVLVVVLIHASSVNTVGLVHWWGLDT
jgi:hypothetical protein